MKLDRRPTEQPLPFRFVLVFFIFTTVVLAIATGFYRQSWQTQQKRTARLQKQLDVLTSTQSGTLKVDPSAATK